MAKRIVVNHILANGITHTNFERPFRIAMEHLSPKACHFIATYLEIGDEKPRYPDYVNMTFKFTKDGRCKVKIADVGGPDKVVVTITNVGDAKTFRQHILTRITI